MSPTPRLFLGLAAAASLLGMGSLLGAGPEASLALGGLGLLTLLQVPLALVVRHRLEGGLGNRGLDAERRLLRGAGHLLNPLGLLLLGFGLAGIAGRPGPDPGTARLLLPMGILVYALIAGRLGKGAEDHPTLVQARLWARTLAWGAGISLAGGLVGTAFGWGDAASGVALALLCFFEGRRLRAAVAVKAACGGCGSCSCG